MEETISGLAASDFPSFIDKAFRIINPGTPYLDNWHIDLLAAHLEAARQGELKRLIINMPPRSLKSLCVSVAWPAWLLGHDPSARIMAASYAGSLAIKHSLDCRQLITSPWYKKMFPGVKLARDQNEKHKFMTSARGYRFATSVGGAATGEGGNFLLIDDPLSPAQAANENARRFANHWFDHTFASRLDDKHKGVIVLVMQRLHEQDLSGYLMEKGGWHQLCLPAVTSERKTYHMGGGKWTRNPGILHEARENQELIDRAKVELGSAAFAAQYQQQPRPEEGGFIHASWFGRYRQLASHERRIQSWDTAIKAGSQHDASVCLTFAEGGGKSYLQHASVARLEYPELKRKLYAMAEEWQPHAILIEDKASGQQLLQDARRETQLPVIGIKPKGDKLTRTAGVTAMLEAGRLYLPEQASWLADFENEVLSFPQGAHDDQLDAMVQYLIWLRQTSFDRLRVRAF